MKLSIFKVGKRSAPLKARSIRAAEKTVKQAKASKALKTRAKSPAKRRVRHVLLTIMAIAITLWPMVVAGMWLYSVLKEERPVYNLPAVSQNAADLKPFDEPMISVTFDDGWESAYHLGTPILSKYNIPATFYNISGTFEDVHYMSEAQMKSLTKAGHEIGSHTDTHPNLTQITDEQLAFELASSKHQLSKVTGTTIQDFASPLNAYNDKVVQMVKSQGYRSHRTTDGVITRDPYNLNLRTNFSVYHIQAYCLRSHTSIEQLRDFLAYAKEQKAWVVLVYHQIASGVTEVPDEDKYAVTQAQFDEQMKLVKESGLRVATMGQVLDHITGVK